MTTTFAALGVSAPLVEALAAQGILEPFPIQALTIADALAGRDVLGKAKTGSGKTLAFGVPLLDTIGQAEPRRPHGLVLVPTRELANQVKDVLGTYLKFKAASKAAKGAKKAAKGTAVYQVAKRTPFVKRIPVVAAGVAGASAVAVVVTKKLRGGDDSAPAAA